MSEALMTKEAVSVSEEILAIKVTDDKSMALANEKLSRINKIADKIKATKDKVLKPLNKARLEEQRRWKPAESEIKTATTHLRKEMGAYKTLCDKKAEEAKSKIIDRVGEGKGKLKVETAAKQIAEVEESESTVETESGKTSFRTDYEVIVVDIHVIPAEYLEVKEGAIKKAHKAGTIVPGVDVQEIQVPINRRN